MINKISQSHFANTILATALSLGVMTNISAKMNKILKTPEYITTAFGIRVLPWQSIDPNIKLSKRKMDSASSRSMLEWMMGWPCGGAYYGEANNLYKGNSSSENDSIRKNPTYNIKLLEVLLNEQIAWHNRHESGMPKSVRGKTHHQIKANWHLTQETVDALGRIDFGCD